MVRWMVFAGASVALACVSRASLRAFHSHGFYRFFAWECILALILLNITVWFRTPLAWYQLVSWTLLITSLVPLSLGVHALAGRGKPVAWRECEPQLMAFERTSTLVTTGIFGYIRHPLYCSLLLLAWGVFFKAPGWIGGLLAAASTALLFATATAEEAECVRFFGDAYVVYMGKTRRFVPYLL